MLVSLSHVHKYYGDFHVLNDISLTVENSDRLGIVGENGCGKSTLLRLITEETLPDSEGGREAVISKASHLRVGYLAQDAGLDGENTVETEMNAAFAPLIAANERMRALEREMERSPLDAESADEYARLQAFFEVNEGYSSDVRIRAVLSGMGFSPDILGRKISSFSGGEKTRLAVCRLLLESPELLILDEPTNHLDFKTVAWLEDYLSAWRGAMLLVSHDRLFLERLCGGICEIEHGILTRYKGSYSAFIRQREESKERQKRVYEAQRAEIEKLETYVARNKVRAATAKSAAAREKKLEKMERVQKPFEPSKAAKIAFTYAAEPVRDVLQARNLTLTAGIGGRVLLENASFSVQRGEKIGIIGENGAGKSTLLKALRGVVPYRGAVSWGEGTRLGVFEQESESLDKNTTVFDEIKNRCPAMSDFEVRSLLGQVRLTGENVFKETGVISGGERAKLCFAILMTEHGNVLLLDEPTNHLDLSAREVLENALLDYEGTILFVSHDRYLLSRLADRLLILENGTLSQWQGGFSSYMESLTPKEQPQKRESKRAAPNPKLQRALGAQTRAKKRDAERRLDELQAEEERLTALTQSEEVMSDYGRLREVCERLEETRAESERVLEELLELEAEENSPS